MLSVHIQFPDRSKLVLDETEVTKLRKKGKLPPGSSYWIEGMSEWRPIEEFDTPEFEEKQSSPSTSATSALIFGCFTLLLVAGAGFGSFFYDFGIYILCLLLSLPTGFLAVVSGMAAWWKIDHSEKKQRDFSLAIGSIFLGCLPILPMLHPPPKLASLHVVNAGNLRQIGFASLIFADEHDGNLPGTFFEENGQADPITIHDVMLLLARHGGVNDLSIWLSRQDPSIGRQWNLSNARILTDGQLHPDVAAGNAVSFDYVTGLTTDHPSTTPIAWTRGLREDGTWDPEGGYGRIVQGGHILFLGGNIAYYNNLRFEEGGRLIALDGTRTSNILLTLPEGSRVVGAGPGTLNGRTAPEQ